MSTAGALSATNAALCCCVGVSQSSAGGDRSGPVRRLRRHTLGKVHETEYTLGRFPNSWDTKLSTICFGLIALVAGFSANRITTPRALAGRGTAGGRRGT